MGNLSTLAAGVTYDALTAEVSFTLVRCEARPITAGLAPALAALLADVATTSKDERQLVIEVLRADVLVTMADEDIDGTIDAVVNNILTITGGDREHDLYLHFLGDKTPAELKEPVLSEELETVRLWVPSLMTSPFPGLAAIGPILAQQITVADQAKAQLDTALQNLKQFREVGARKALVDNINARRKATYGALGEIAHSSPQLNLSKDFADRFFMHEQRRRRPSSKELKIRLGAAQATVAELEKKVAEAEAFEKAAADRKTAFESKAYQRKVAAAQKKADAAAATLAALQAKSTP